MINKQMVLDLILIPFADPYVCIHANPQYIYQYMYLVKRGFSLELVFNRIQVNLTCFFKIGLFQVGGARHFAEISIE